MISARPLRTGLALALAAATLTGCAGIGKALGSGKNPPDEFAIATKAPLVVPPEYALRPPKPAPPAQRLGALRDRHDSFLLSDKHIVNGSTGHAYRPPSPTFAFSSSNQFWTSLMCG